MPSYESLLAPLLRRGSLFIGSLRQWNSASRRSNFLHASTIFRYFPAYVPLTHSNLGAMNNPFRGTLETFLNGPDSSTSGHECNLCFTNFSAVRMSCTSNGETSLGTVTVVTPILRKTLGVPSDDGARFAGLKKVAAVQHNPWRGSTLSRQFYAGTFRSVQSGRVRNFGRWLIGEAFERMCLRSDF